MIINISKIERRRVDFLGSEKVVLGHPNQTWSLSYDTSFRNKLKSSEKNFRRRMALLEIRWCGITVFHKQIRVITLFLVNNAVGMQNFKFISERTNIAIFEIWPFASRQTICCTYTVCNDVFYEQSFAKNLMFLVVWVNWQPGAIEGCNPHVIHFVILT